MNVCLLRILDAPIRGSASPRQVWGSLSWLVFCFVKATEITELRVLLVRKSSKTVGSHFLDPTSGGGFEEQWLEGRQALELRGPGSDPDYVTLGQLQSLCTSMSSFLEKGRYYSILGERDEAVHARYLLSVPGRLLQHHHMLNNSCSEAGFEGWGVVYV